MEDRATRMAERTRLLVVEEEEEDEVWYCCDLENEGPGFYVVGVFFLIASAFCFYEFLTGGLFIDVIYS